MSLRPIVSHVHGRDDFSIPPSSSIQGAPSIAGSIAGSGTPDFPSWEARPHIQLQHPNASGDTFDRPVPAGWRPEFRFSSGRKAPHRCLDRPTE
jgi:hypothetical protein